MPPFWDVITKSGSDFRDRDWNCKESRSQIGIDRRALRADNISAQSIASLKLRLGDI